jgi:hypothetical protein
LSALARARPKAAIEHFFRGVMPQEHDAQMNELIVFHAGVLVFSHAGVAQMMRHRFNCAVSLLIAAWLISLPAHAEDFPIIGSWIIEQAIVAPWIRPNVDIARFTALSRAHLHMIVSFFPDHVEAKDPELACTNVDYERTLLSPEQIFQGNLPDPDQVEIAAELGFPSGKIPGFDAGCASSSQSYHFANRDTLLFALDDIIYTMDRQ